MKFNTSLSLDKSLFDPMELYYDTLEDFIEKTVNDSTLYIIKEEYKKLPNNVTLEQITDMYNAGFKNSIVGKISIVEVVATPTNFSIFFESADIDSFILDIDTRDKDDFILTLN